MHVLPRHPIHEPFSASLVPWPRLVPLSSIPMLVYRAHLAAAAPAASQPRAPMLSRDERVRMMLATSDAAARDRATAPSCGVATSRTTTARLGPARALRRPLRAAAQGASACAPSRHEALCAHAATLAQLWRPHKTHAHRGTLAAARLLWRRDRRPAAPARRRARPKPGFVRWKAAEVAPRRRGGSRSRRRRPDAGVRARAHGCAAARRTDIRRCALWRSKARSRPQ